MMSDPFECHCGNTISEIFSVHDEGNYRLCASCKTLQYSPYPDQQALDKFYSEYAAYKSNLSEYLSGSDYDVFISTKKLTMFDLGTPLSSFKGKRYLDIGCGTGHWLRYLNENNLTDGYGIDTSPECVSLGKKFGVDIRNTDFFDISEKFDLMFMSHLIEHVRSPGAFIEQCANLLNDNGILIIETPVYGPVAECFGEKWRYLMPVEHLNIFSVEALNQLLSNYGFHIKKAITFGSGINSTQHNQIDKRAMDRMTKKLNIGDTYAGCFIKKAS